MREILLFSLFSWFFTVNSFAECEFKIFDDNQNELHELKTTKVNFNNLPGDLEGIVTVDLYSTSVSVETPRCRDYLKIVDSTTGRNVTIKTRFTDPDHNLTQQQREHVESVLSPYQTLVHVKTEDDNNLWSYISCVKKNISAKESVAKIFKNCGVSSSPPSFCHSIYDEDQGINPKSIEDNKVNFEKGLQNAKRHLKAVMISSGLDPSKLNFVKSCDEESEYNSELTKSCPMTDEQYYISRGENTEFRSFCTGLRLKDDSGLNYFTNDIAEILNKNQKEERAHYSFTIRASAIGKTLDLYSQYIGDPLNKVYPGESSSFIDQLSKSKCAKKYPGTSKDFMSGFMEYQKRALTQPDNGLDENSDDQVSKIYKKAISLSRALNGEPLESFYTCLSRKEEQRKECCKSKPLKEIINNPVCSSGFLERRSKFVEGLQENAILATSYDNVNDGSLGMFSSKDGFYDINSWKMLKKIIDTKGDTTKLKMLVGESKNQLRKDYQEYILKICDQDQIPNSAIFRNPQLTKDVTDLLPYKETQRCIDYLNSTIDSNKSTLKHLLNVSCLPASFTGIGAVMCGAYAIGGASFDEYQKESAAEESARLVTGAGGGSTVENLETSTASADNSISNIGQSILFSLPGGAFGKTAKLSKKTAKYSKGANKGWTAISTGRNSLVTFSDNSTINYSDVNFDRAHMTESQLKAVLIGDLISLSKEQRDRVIEEKVEEHRKFFKYSMQDQYWRATKAREISNYYGPISIVDGLVDEDILKILELESKMTSKNIPPSDRVKFRKTIINNINKVDNPNGFLKFIEEGIETYE